ncbi:glycosyltransferase family 2 protein [Anabaena sp. CCY 0017]|uniref:glycosyltransferase family 2 protein n=1 Tax=Anabaena sp. CCY 0017 TaxID=3103866 RepID=UPI0039C5D2BA
MPTISIITPLYNKAAYISETINSVLSQTYLDWEMLIIDNGSTDNSAAIAKEFQLKDKRIQLLASPRKGPGAARNYGIRFSQGTWIQFLDADDLLEPDHLEKQLEVANKNPEAEIIGGWWQEFQDENKPARILKKPTGIGQTIQELRDSAIAFAPWAIHAVLIKRTAISPEYNWPEELDQLLGEDITFWYKLVSKCQVAYGENRGALYRIHTPECRSQNLNPEKWFKGVHKAIKLNQQYLQSHQQFYTSGQCENLMRVYLDIAFLSTTKHSVSVQNQALYLAYKWLDQYFSVSNSPKLSMILRNLLGLKNWIKIKLLFDFFNVKLTK